MQSGQAQFPHTVTIYKAPHKDRWQKLLEEGCQPTDFSYNSPYLDGSCYFASLNDRSIAEEFNQDFKTLEYRYDKNDDFERIEVVMSGLYCLNMNDLEGIK